MSPISAAATAPIPVPKEVYDAFLLERVGRVIRAVGVAEGGDNDSV